MRHVLITGSTGFIGRRLLRRLARQDLRIRVLVRDPARLPANLRGRLEIVRGQLGNESTAEAAMTGVDHVLHLAAKADACAADPGEFQRANARAVGILLEAAARHDVRRFLHVSSVAALPASGPPRARGFPRMGLTEYAASKLASEDIVRRYVAAGHDAVVVRPTRVFGPGPWNDANGATRLVTLYLKGKMRILPSDGGVLSNWVHVDDVAAGIELAARRGEPGAAYNLGGENISLAGYLECVAELTGVRRRCLFLPPLAILPAAHAGKAWGRLGGKVSLTPEWLGYFLENRPVDISRARSDLGYRPRSLRKGLSQTLDWIGAQRKGPWHVDIPNLARA